MRILHVVHQYPPDYMGGTEQYTRSLATYQARHGHTVAVFCPSPVEPAAQPIGPADEDGVSVYRVPVGPRDSQAIFFSTFRLPAVAQSFGRTLDQFQPGLVHVQHLMGLPASLDQYLKAARVPLVVTLHDYFYFCANALLLTNYDQTLCSGPRAWINCGHCAIARAGQQGLSWLSPVVAPLMAYRQSVLWRILRSAAAIIAPTEFVAGVYQKMGLRSESLHVIAHGIDVPADGRSETEEHSRHAGLRIAFVGSLAYQKGAHVLVEAVNQLRGDDVRAVFFGDATAFPEYAANLSRRAQHPGIKFVGRLPRAELWTALRTMDVLVMPSLSYESSSLAIQEAYAAGVPVVASDIGALRETTLAGGGGVLFPPGDVAALRDILQRFMDDPSSLHRLRAYIRPVRTLHDHAAEVEAVYRVVVSGRS